MSRSDTWMPLYIGDYLADTGHLSTAEHGAYLLLIMHYWRNGFLPDDDGDLARMGRVTEEEWNGGIGGRVRRFFKARNGRLFHKRIEVELKKAEKNRKKRAKSGQLGGKAKAEKAKQNQQDASKCQDFASDLLENSQTPSPSPIPSKEERKKDSELRSASAEAQAEIFLPGQVDAKTELFRTGLAIVSRMTGKPEKSLRSQLGQWLKAAREDASVVMACIRECEDLRPAEPISWLVKAIEHRGRKLSSLAKISEDWALPSLAEMDAFAAESRAQLIAETAEPRKPH